MTPTTPSAAIPVSHAARNDHKLPSHDRHLKGHRITVKGLYLRNPDKRDSTGTHGKEKVAYQESFDLGPAEHRVDGQGSLGHILTDGFLAKRLAEKDPAFRAVSTHHVVAHSNVWESDGEYLARKNAEAAAKRTAQVKKMIEEAKGPATPPPPPAPLEENFEETDEPTEPEVDL